MRLSESHALPVALADAWSALNDIGLLQRALPGCESLLEIAPEEFVGEMTVALGPTTSRFTVYVRRHDIEAPRRCALHFETRTAGLAGRGGAVLRLVADGAACTIVHADIDVDVDGVAGMLGAPLIDLAAHEMARRFFEGLQALAGARRARARLAGA